MKEILNIDLIIERTMEAFKCKTQRQLSDLFNISPENFSAKKKRGTLTKLIEKEADRRGINYNWIRSGQGSMTITDEGLRVAENQSSYSSGSNSYDIENAKTSDLLLKTAQILDSQTIYRTALKSNIIAFHEALVSTQEINALKGRMESLEEEMKELRERLKQSAAG